MKRIRNVFVSYSRDDKHWTYEFAKALREDLNYSVFVDYRNIHIGTDWWRTICENIEACDCAIYVMTPKSIESLYCRAEIDYLLALNKPILPIMLKTGTFPSELGAKRVQYLTISDTMQIDRVLIEIQKGMFEVQSLLFQGEYRDPDPLPTRPDEPKPKDSKSAEEVFDLAAEAAHEGQLEQAEALYVEVVKADNGSFGRLAARRLTELRAYQQVVRRAAKPATMRDARELWREYMDTHGRDFDPLGMTEKLDAPLTPQPPLPQGARGGYGQGQTPMPEWARGSETPPAPKPTPPPAKPDPVQEALTRARNFIREGKKNADWTPFIVKFPNLKIPDMPFCLVPTGTFMMGADNISSYEKPVFPQIFEQAFYIAQYPVTNAQWRLAVETRVVDEPQNEYALKWYNDLEMRNAPVVGLSWFECQKFAAWMDCLLPTEREWEYAARGVDNLVYPWGNEFIADNVVYDGNSGGKPWAVTSKPKGQSWIGAYHLSGNVREWTASLYEAYPYVADGSRERDTGSRSNLRRVIRCGAWNYSRGGTHATYRNGEFPYTQNFSVGFRVSRVIPS